MGEKRKPTQKQVNEVHEKYKAWVKNSGQVGTQADLTATEAMNRKIGTPKISTTTPPPVIVYRNETPKKEGEG